MKSIVLASAILAAWIPTGAVFAAEDFKSYSNEEFFQLRDRMRYMSEADREAYRAERHNREQNMSQEERRSMYGEKSTGETRNMWGADSGKGTVTRSRVRDGSGSGESHSYGQGGGYSQGGGQGQGGGSGGGRGR